MREQMPQTNEDPKSYEKCVLCRQTVKIRISQTVSSRKYYVEGAGQLCPACYARVYETWNHGQAGKKAAP
ncbi:MAG TPA: hypothetical protein IAA06_07660 [Candidatus Blautia faecavium]|uniref:Uncharacterized protein n=1 Tax=Candidatus Blautia faecavium TaxID=2838487 RepID=A0A9D2LS77_9FIRM|nr:hypothetical protein [Candidatus Blautia faecavium]